MPPDDTGGGGICDIPVIAPLCDAVGDTTASLVTAPFDFLGHGMADLAGFVFQGAWSVMTTTTLVDLTEPGITSIYNLVFGIAVIVMLGFFLLQLITAMLRRDPAALAHAATGLAKSVFGSFVLLSLATLALEIVDQLCVGIAQAAGTTISDLGAQMGLLIAGLSAVTIASPGAGVLILLFFGGLALAATAILWFSLLIRKALILILIVLGPIAFAGWGWEHTRAWVGRWLSFLIALIVSKLVIVIVFLVATTLIGSPLEFDLASLADPLAGIVLLLIAGFAPYMVYKLISFMGFDIYQMMSMEQESKNALDRPLPLPSITPGAPPRTLDVGRDTSPSPGSPSPSAGAMPASQAGEAASGSGPAGAAASAAPAASGAGTASAGTASAGTAASAGAGAATGGATIAAQVAIETGTTTWNAGPQAGAQVSSAADQATTPATTPPPPSPPIPKENP
jgi:hypothetical protein